MPKLSSSNTITLFGLVKDKLKMRNRQRQLRGTSLAVILLVAFHVWLHITNPYADISIVQQPYTTYIDKGQIKAKKNFDLKVHSNFMARSLGYYKSGFLIAQNTFSPSRLTDKKSVNETINDIHELRFDPTKPYLISGNQFSVLYTRNLGVFYNSLLDPRTALSQTDWEHRQQIYLQSALYALDSFSGGRQLTTTIVPISPRSVALTQVHPGSQPSDTLYGLLFAFQALSQSSEYPNESYKIKTIDTTQRILEERRSDFQMLLKLYLDQVQDPQTGMIKRHLILSGARDGVTRDSSFYDNVVLWSTLKLATDLGIQKYSPEYITELRTAIVSEYWDEQIGIFSDEYRDAGQPAIFSADWLIAIPTGFLKSADIQDRTKLVRIVEYSEKNGLTDPLPIKYTIAKHTGQKPAAVRWFVPNYGGDVIWSYWGAEYITLLNNLARSTQNKNYSQQAGDDIKAYDERIAQYGGFPETFKPDGTFLKTFFYKSILETGWVVQYERARYEFEHPTH